MDGWMGGWMDFSCCGLKDGRYSSRIASCWLVGWLWFYVPLDDMSPHIHTCTHTHTCARDRWMGGKMIFVEEGPTDGCLAWHGMDMCKRVAHSSACRPCRRARVGGWIDGSIVCFNQPMAMINVNQCERVRLREREREMSKRAFQLT